MRSTEFTAWILYVQYMIVTVLLLVTIEAAWWGWVAQIIFVAFWAWMIIQDRKMDDEKDRKKRITVIQCGGHLDDDDSIDWEKAVGQLFPEGEDE